MYSKVLNLIPLSSLAAILFLVGNKTTNASLFKAMYRSGRTNFIPFIATSEVVSLISLWVSVLDLLFRFCLFYTITTKTIYLRASKHIRIKYSP